MWVRVPPPALLGPDADAAGLDPTILRVAALFYENVLVLHGDEIRAGGRFANSCTGPAPWISGRDAAAHGAPGVVNPAMAQHISAVGAMVASRAAAIAPDPRRLEDLIGHPPLSFADFVREHRDEFTPAARTRPS